MLELPADAEVVTNETVGLESKLVFDDVANVVPALVVDNKERGVDAGGSFKNIVVVVKINKYHLYF